MAWHYSEEAFILNTEFGMDERAINQACGLGYSACKEDEGKFYATGRTEERVIAKLLAKKQSEVAEQQAAREVESTITPDVADKPIVVSGPPATARQQALILNLMKDGRHLEGGMTDLSRITYADVATLDKRTASFWITSLLGHY